MGRGVECNEKGGGDERGGERFEREFLLLVESSWAGGPFEYNELNELLNQLTNQWPAF